MVTPSAELTHPLRPLEAARLSEEAIDAACLRLAYSTYKSRAISTIIAPVTIAWLLSAQVPPGRLLGWLGVVLCCVAARFAQGHWFQSGPTTDERARWSLPWFAAGNLASAATWGALIAVCGMSTSLLIIVPILLAVAGMMATGAHSSASTPRIMIGQIAVGQLPITVHMIFSGAPELRTLALLVVAYAAVILGTVKVNNREIRASIALRFENQDLLEQLRIEKQREQAARIDAEKANQEKSRFLAAASHDARQPLHALGLFVDALKARPLDAEAERLVTSVDLAQTSLISLHEGLLDLATLDVGVLVPQVRPVRVRDLLRVIQNESAPRANAHGLTLHVSAPDLWVATDAALTLRILRNLVANALAYTARGGVLVAARRRGEQVLMQVWDTGIGVAPAQQQLIFEELYQVGNEQRNPAQGLGLGLSIVRRLARTLGTEIGLRSVPGRGSVFSFLLPQTTASEAPSDVVAPLAAVAAPTGAAGCVVLLVDDDGLSREALGAMLTLWGYEVVAAQDAAEALEYAAALDRIDVVVSDLWLPGRSGLDLLRDLAAQHPLALRLVISGDTAPDTETKVAATGAVFIRKPVRAALLRAALQKSVALKAG